MCCEGVFVRVLCFEIGKVFGFICRKQFDFAAFEMVERNPNVHTGNHPVGRNAWQRKVCISAYGKRITTRANRLNRNNPSYKLNGDTDVWTAFA